MIQPDPHTGLVELSAERECVLRIKNGDRAAAGQLYAWYGDRIYRRSILPRLPIVELAEDVLKDSFRVALEKIESFEHRDRSIFFWLHRIAVNRAIDEHRKHQRDRRLQAPGRIADTIELSMAKPPAAPDHGLHTAETKALVRKALSQMNKRYALALQLRLLDDLDREECAERMAVKVATFDVLFFRACKAFRKGWPPK